MPTPAGDAMAFGRPWGLYAAPERRAGSDVRERECFCDGPLRGQFLLTESPDGPGRAHVPRAPALK